MPPLKELVRKVHEEEGKLMGIRNTLKGTAKEREKWERSHEDEKDAQIRALSIRIAILEEQLHDQEAVVEQQQATLRVARKRIEQGGEESEQEKFARIQYERANAEKDLKNVSTKLNETDQAVEDRFSTISELRREQAEAKHYQEVAQARVDKLAAELAKSNKWQVIAVEVRRALLKERDGLTWQVENDRSLTPDVRNAMREKMEAMKQQIIDEDEKAVRLTKRRHEMEAEIALLTGRIQKSKDDVSY